ncbi:MAG TPA: glycosyltransferase family 4 protein [Gemmataceae bacterium]|jgi:glycosyltransferase involved in cell wall biosynthesis
MRILYVSQYFPPEMGAPAARVHELSREWVRQSHDVTVLTAFAHHPTGIKAPRDYGVLTRRESVEGIRLIRTYVYAAANKGTLKRMASYASFMLSAATIGRLRVPRPDVVVATSPQLLCAAAGWFLARTLRAPFIFEVRDLWPESILAVEALKDSMLIRAMKRLARFLYQNCDRIVTVGEGYRRGIHDRYGIAEHKMDVIRNGIDTSLFVPSARDNEVRKHYGWGDRFVIMYVGTHGMAHGLHQVLEAADALRGEPDKLFVFVGEGAEKDNLKRQAAQRRLPNVQFIDQQPKNRIPLFYAACDLGLVTLRDAPLFQEVLPSKIFEYFGMERAILLNVAGEARQVVEAARGGAYVPSGDVPALIGAIRELARRRAELDEMGRRGRQFVLEQFDRRVLAKRYLDVLESVAHSFPRRTR